MPATSDSSPAYSRARPAYSAGAAVASSDSSSSRRARICPSRWSRGVWAVAIGSAAQPLRHAGGRDLLLGAAVEVADLDDVAGQLVVAERERVARAEPARPPHPLAGAGPPRPAPPPPPGGGRARDGPAPQPPPRPAAAGRAPGRAARPPRRSGRW